MTERDTIYEMLSVIQGWFYGKYRGQVKDNEDPTAVDG